MDRAFRDWTEATLRELQPDGSPRSPDWQPLAVEASHRRFFRVCPDAAAAPCRVAMSSPPALENNAQFTTLARVFHQRGVGVPELLACDPERGYFLMEDLGRVHLADVYRAAGADGVMPAVLDTLHRIQQVDDPAVPPYTRERFADELDIYATWFLGRLLDSEPPAGLEDAFAALLAATDRQPRCCVHRDFHCRNLLVAATGRIGVVDFQDALVGPATYDLASLLRDCYHRFSEAEVARWREAYLDATPLPVDRHGFARDLDLTALQRQLKAVGIFARLHLRDGRDSHLSHVVPVLERIGELAGSYPELTALARHVHAILPATRRRLGGAP